MQQPWYRSYLVKSLLISGVVLGVLIGGVSLFAVQLIREMTTDYSKIGQELADAFAGKYKGTTVSLLHGLSGDEENKFKAQWTDFQAKTGITVKLVPGSTTESIAVKAQSGTIEDIVNFPQPGTMGSYAKQGKIIDLNKFIKADWLKKNYNQGFIDTNTVPDASGKPILGGVFNRIN